MSTPIPARVAAEAAQAEQDLAALAAAAQPPAPAPPEPAPPAPPAPPQAPTAAPVPDTSLELRRLSQQLATMQGRLDASEQDRILLRTQLQQAQAAPPAPPTPPAPPASLLTEKERSEYGEEFIDVVTRILKQTLGTQLTDLGTRIAGLEGRIGSTLQQVKAVQQETREQVIARYENSLNTKIPGWEQVNVDPQFLDWLENVDTLTGKKYMDLLADAHERADANRVIHIFRLYKPDLGTGTPAATPAPPAPPAPPTGHIDPNSVIAPATSPAAPAPANPPAARVWTMGEVDKLYEDKEKGRITPSEFVKLEREYLTALAEGRVAAA